MKQTQEQIEEQRRRIEIEKKKQEKLEDERRRIELLEEWKKEHPNANIQLPQKEKELTPEEKIEKFGKAISLNTYNNEGNICLKTIRIYLKNLLKDEYEKYMKIGTLNPAFKERVKSVIGGIQFLESVGFVDEGEFMVLKERNIDLINKGIEVINKYYQ